jgi:L-lactate utilization protein LutC
MRYRNCVKIIVVVILWSFLMIPVFGEQPTAHGTATTEGSTKFYSDTEVRELIEELSEAAEEAIERAAGEAAKAAAVASLEREAVALAEAAHLQAEAIRWQKEYTTLKRAGFKTAVITGALCFFGGLAVGAGTVAIIGGR